MEYTKFSLGLRFAMTSDANLTPDDCWRVAFGEVPLTHIVGATIFGAWDNIGSAESESAYICLFSNLPLKTGKALYAQLLQKPVLLSYLTIYKPFIQNNLVEKCADVEFLGRVNAEGAVLGGDAAYAQMRFSGALPEPCLQLPACRRILIAPDAWEGRFTSADAVRRMLRAAAKVVPKAVFETQLIADGGRGTLDALVCSVNGRYLKANLTEPDGSTRELRYGILPDRTVVIETESLSEDELKQALSLPQNKGYAQYILAAGGGALPKALPDGIETIILGSRIPSAMKHIERIEFRSGVETVLDRCRFDYRLRRANWLILLTHLMDADGSLQDPTADALLFHCRALKKHAAVLAFSSDGTYYAKIDGSALVPLVAASFDEASEALFDIIKSSAEGVAPWFRLPETLIKDL